MVHTPQPSSILCQFIGWHIWACDKYYNRPRGYERIYAPGDTLSHLALRRFFWKESYGKGKGVIRILDKRHLFVFSITFARNAVRASEPQGEPDQTAFLNHLLILFSSRKVVLLMGRMKRASPKRAHCQAAVVSSFHDAQGASKARSPPFHGAQRNCH